MILDELIQIIRNSEYDDWQDIGSNGPLFTHRIIMNGKSANFDQHLEYASYKPNVSITIAWDLVDSEDFKAVWANNHINPDAKSYWFDVFYNNALVFRTYYVGVDGGNFNIPVPTLNGGAWEVSNEYSEFVNILNKIHGHEGEFDRYMHGLTIINKTWDY